MKHILFALPGNEPLAHTLAAILDAAVGEAEIRHFPDGETYVRVLSEVSGKEAVLVCTLHRPDDKLLPLYLLSQTIRELGAARITLVAPYLAYMRQDKQFKKGEGITSRYVARLIESITDSLLTIDPHLHRIHHMQELYTIPARALHAAPLIAEWVQQHVQKPVLIGPDEESMQWVTAVAALAKAPALVLQKTRLGDEEVQVTLPQLADYPNHTPVLVDDIISTAHTMIETVQHLRGMTTLKPVCIGVHAVFAEGAYEALLQAGAEKVITCNTIPHASNGIAVDTLLAEAIMHPE
ncbi:ribose-phosphate pyrophosphokinase [Pontibacter anaerobius]|uniref:ribose-phosphate diphosphokinase n=1 Tax=Pontibacter anaerobius TaxID=2993940 RepID=A0ABT3RDW3_9BACT|nr:ribose-phosphate pyrophosphokinase [Pontibacter anaerobius]MCX2739804.1 ribose-phosphate pyrophosphokinase [Pontibacter anaerobius]